MTKNSNTFLLTLDSLPNPFDFKIGDVYRGIGDMDSEIRLVITNVNTTQHNQKVSWIITDSYENFTSTSDELRMRLVCSMLHPFGKVDLTPPVSD